MGCLFITLGSRAMAMACSEDGSVLSGVGLVGKQDTTAPASTMLAKKTRGIPSAQLTENDSGLFVQLEVQPVEGLLTPLKAKLISTMVGNSPFFLAVSFIPDWMAE